MRDDAIICTGRSDYPNQVNNVLCFPFIFRGALDVGASTITEEMKMAAEGDRRTGRAEQSEVVALGLWREGLRLRPGIPDPQTFDPRLIVKIAPAVAKAGWIPASPPGRSATGMLTRRASTNSSPPGLIMKPVFFAGQAQPEAHRLCRGRGMSACCACTGRRRGICRPILIGRPRRRCSARSMPPVCASAPTSISKSSIRSLQLLRRTPRVTGRTTIA